jgi:N-acetyl-anhydromuramyl-L-alanine amidase AmpD
MLSFILDAWKKLTTPPPDPWANLAPLHVNEAGWLEGEGVVCIPSHPSWYYPKLSTASGDPTAIVVHASATRPGTGVTMAKNRVKLRKPDQRAASWHASVEVDHIVQQAPFEVGCWHAVGQIKGAGPANRVSIGIELVGFEKGPWPEGQVMQAARIWRALVQSYGIKRSLAMVPHAVLDPARRSDPGAEFMKKHAERVLDYAFRP